MKAKLGVALITLAAVAFPLWLAAGNTSTAAEAKLAAVNAMRNLPLRFEPAPAPGRYVARSGGYSVLIGATESSVTLPDTVSGTVSVLRFGLEGANAAASIDAIDPLPGVTNYYQGNDPGKWRLGVKNFAKLRAMEVYPGIDVVYYGDHQRLEFDFVVAPNINPDAIALTFSGMDKLYLDAAGDLVAEINGHPVRLAKPVAYQKVAGNTKPVSLAYVLGGKNRARLQIGDYDKNLELVIDPTLSYSTYLGGSQGDTANGIAVDAAGNAYITGKTCSIGKDTNPVPFPAPNPNPSGTVLEGVSPACDAYVTKLNATGSALVFTTFISGTAPYPANAFASGNGITLDDVSLNLKPAHLAAGDGDGYPNVYVVGTSSFQDMPQVGLKLTPPPNGADYTSTYNGGDSDAFIAILNSQTGTLIRSTYLGGNLADAGYAIAVDPQQNVTVVGQTNSFNFPGYNGFEPITEAYVAFVTKLDFGLHIATPGVIQSTTVTCPAPLTSRCYQVLPGPSPMTPRAPGSQTDSCLAGHPCPTAVDPNQTYYFFSAVYGGQLNAPPPTLSYPYNATPANPQLVPAGAITQVTPICPVTSPPTVYEPLRMVATNQGYVSGIIWATGSNCASYQVGDNITEPTLLAPNSPPVIWKVLGVGPFPPIIYATTEAYGVALDPGGDVFVVGGSNTADLHPSLPGGQNEDWLPQADTHYKGTGAWIIKLLGSDTAGSVIGNYPVTGQSGWPVYLTPLGTNQTDVTQTVNAARGITVDSQGRAYVVGTATGGIYTTTGSLNPSVIGGADAFVLRMNTAGSGIDYGTYLGGTGTDQGLGVAVDAGGYAYVVGSTQSTNIPVINAVIDASGNTLKQLRGAQPEAYLTKVTPDGTALIMSAYLGGSGGDQGNAIALSKSGTGDIYLAGTTSSYDFPLQPLAPASPVTGISAYAGNGDAFVTKISGASFPMVSVSPVSQSLTFANQAVGFSSAATQTVTLTSTGQVPVNITGVTITGDFTQANNCGTGLTAATGTQNSCTITVTFTPTSVGTRSGVLTISDDATNSPQTVGVTGNGVLVQDSVSPTSLTFASQVIGTTSTAQTVTVKNTDPSQTLIMSSVVPSGDYGVSSNTCTTLLTPGQSCTVGVTFTPTAPGSRIGTLVINGNGNTFPATVQLTGIGNGSGTPSGSTPDFTVLATAVTVSRGSQASSTITLTPVNGFAQSVTLTCLVPSPATCTVSPSSVALTGAGTGTATAMVSVPGSGSSSGNTPKGASLHHGQPWRTILPFSVFGIVLLGRRRRFWLALLLLSLCLTLSFVACGGNSSGGSSSSTPTTLSPGSYTASVTATYTAGGVSHTSSVTLTVN